MHFCWGVQWVVTFINVQFSSVGGQVVRVFAFQSDGLTSNLTEVGNFFLIEKIEQVVLELTVLVKIKQDCEVVAHFKILILHLVPLLSDQVASVG